MTEGRKIQFKQGKMVTPDYPIIPFIEGDGIGPDIWKAAQLVFDAAVEKAYGGARRIVWKEVLAGEKAFRRTGEWLPQKTLTTIKDHLIALKGPLTTPIGEGYRSLNVTLRQELDLYVCLRPVRYFEGVPSPLKRPELTDMVIFRENTEDIYAGIEFEKDSAEAKQLIDFLTGTMGVDNIRFPQTSAIGLKPISKEGSDHLIRAAMQYAIKENRPTLTFVHKGNIMKYTEGGFKKWGYELAEKEYGGQVFTWNQYHRIREVEGLKAADAAQQAAIEAGKIIVKDIIADNFLQEILIRPDEYDVVATMNLNGDYISDALAAQVGGIGISPGANINYHTGHAIFEATHGTAPKLAGQDKVNPSSVILSGTMMLQHIGWHEPADLIVRALEKTIANKTVTFDFADFMEGATKVSCSGFGELLIENL